MRAHLLVGSALLSQGLADVVVPSPADETSPAITPGPQIELLRRQNNDRFMGWVQNDGLWISQQCAAGNTFFQTGTNWACCTTTRAGCANMPVGCVAGSMIYRVTPTGTASLSNTLLTIPCTSIWTESSDISYSVCNTGVMFENSNDNSPKTQIFCGVVSSRWSYYRQQPFTSATSARAASATPASSPARSTPTSNTSPTPILTSSLTQPEPEKEKSKAWIAGAVIGPLVGLALIGLGAFFFIRRKKNKPQVAPATGGVGPAGPSAYEQNSYPQGPNSPPQYYPPPMQQNAGAPGFAPVGVAKQDNYYNPQSPVSQAPQSPNTQSVYGAPQQWQQGGQPVYNVPSPSISPQPQHAAPYHGTERHFSSELEGSNAHGQPQVISVQPK